VPDPARLFAERAARLNVLASTGSEIAPYLRFLGAICGIQHSIQESLPELDPPDEAACARARDFGMPPIDRNMFAVEAGFETLEQLVQGVSAVELPTMAVEALGRLTHAGSPERSNMMRNVLADAIPMQALAEHVLVAAALQVDFARLAAHLDARKLVPVADGACPACGAPPVSSLIVGWRGAHSSRFCACSLCGTLWNYVRIKCTLCGSTEGIGYREIGGGPGTVKAETCDKCGCYVKILHQHKDPSLEPVADDVATLGLDMLMSEGGYRRGSFNPFLIGY
jgi:FdhE protein